MGTAIVENPDEEAASVERGKGLRGILESSRPRRQPFTEYRRFVQRRYDGIAGVFTRFTGLVTGHEALAGRLIRPDAFDVRGCKRILDAGCGNGRYTRLILRYADPDAEITAYRVAKRVNKVQDENKQRIDGPECIEPIAEQANFLA